MTRLEAGKSVKRETAATYRGRAVIIELHPRHAILRLKGSRERVEIDYLTVLETAWKRRYLASQAEKWAARKRRTR